MYFGLTNFKSKVNELDIITARKMKFSIKDFLSKCNQVCSFMWIWSHLLKRFSMENFIFCGVCYSKNC